ncbi:hypothetical protein AAGW18_06965 [Vreelandella titanicae]|uniref:hypothetical protein n=1 Tax=Vreelandella titanicae TaxID=664683 RepID=UPI00241FC2C6|nr:hypothetical protein [Halomonas titanicae]UEQ03824.1 hypothetical protein LMS44_21520 [Halomonas profundus]
MMADRWKHPWLGHLVMLVLGCCLPDSPTLAAEAPWADREYRYIVIEQSVRDVLQEFGRNLSLPVEVSDAVDGEVRGDIRASTAGEFLEQVCESNGLAWFYDGYVLHVAARQELSRRRFELTDVDVPRLRAEITQAQVGKPLSAMINAEHDSLEVMGPPAWIADIAQRVDALRQPSAPSIPAEVKVFRGSVAQPPGS